MSNACNFISGKQYILNTYIYIISKHITLDSHYEEIPAQQAYNDDLLNELNLHRKQIIHRIKLLST